MKKVFECVCVCFGLGNELTTLDFPRTFADEDCAFTYRLISSWYSRKMSKKTYTWQLLVAKRFAVLMTPISVPMFGKYSLANQLGSMRKKNYK